METKKVFVVIKNSDLTEGRGHRVIECFCEKQATARRKAAGIDVQGSDGIISEITVYKPEKEDIKWRNWWYGPVSIELPSKVDLKEQQKIDEYNLRLSVAKKALERAKELGLTDEEINALQQWGIDLK